MSLAPERDVQNKNLLPFIRSEYIPNVPLRPPRVAQGSPSPQKAPDK
jgi:hypothetical protein